MIRLPRRVSLVAETAATLKEWIAGGVLGPTLPGELPLKNRLGVGRDTVRRSLKILEHEGWISSGQQGQQRKTLRPPSALPPVANSKKLPVIFLSPRTIVDRIILLEMDDVQKRLAEQGRELRYLSPNIFRQRHPERHLARVVSDNPSAAWILYLVGERVQKWFEDQRIPAFIYGTPSPKSNLPFVVNDWESAAFHAGVQLVREGHTVLGMLQFSEPMPGSVLVAKGLERALATSRPKGSLALFDDDGSPEGIVRSLDAAMASSPRPTAFVFNASNQLLTCLSWMVSRRLAVPGDLSLVSIPSDSWYHELYPPLCYYENNSNLFAHLVGQRVMELVETGEVTAKSVRVPLEYQPGATIGPPPPSRSPDP